MKKILLATTVLVGTAGFAAAEVTLSGDARMGIARTQVDTNTAGATDTFVDQTNFTSRARVSFALSGETDGGLTFGASFRADNAGAASGGTAGSVSLSGAFGTIAMGDNDSAANSLVGNVAGVGLTGLGDKNELGYIGQADSSVLYTNTVGALSFAVSAGALNASATNTIGSAATDAAEVNVAEDAMSVAAKYTAGGYSIALGYETATVDSNSAAAITLVDATQLTLGVSASFGSATAKLVAFQKSVGTVDTDGYAVSVNYVVDATSITAFATDSDTFGAGASYDLGGNAKLVGGAVTDGDNSQYDLGVSFSF